MSVPDRVVLLTGASSGLGEELAVAFAGRGVRVAAVARRAERLAALADRTDGIRGYECDLVDEAATADMVAQVIAELGHVDVLVNCAGVSSHHPAEEPDMQSVRRVLDVNLTAQYWLTSLVGKHMLERRSGSIVNVASIFGLVAAAPTQQVAYAMSKGGLIAMTRHLAVEWADRGVRVNAVAPGFFRSELTDQFLDDAKGDAWVVRSTPLGRPAEVAEVAAAVLWLADDASSYVTGAVIPVDGGWTAR